MPLVRELELLAAKEIMRLDVTAAARERGVPDSTVIRKIPAEQAR
jgi:hypothetical protein